MCFHWTKCLSTSSAVTACARPKKIVFARSTTRNVLHFITPTRSPSCPANKKYGQQCRYMRCKRPSAYLGPPECPRRSWASPQGSWTRARIQCGSYTPFICRIPRRVDTRGKNGVDGTWSQPNTKTARAAASAAVAHQPTVFNARGGTRRRITARTVRAGRASAVAARRCEG